MTPATVALDAYSRAQPKGKCPSCDRALDLVDEKPMLDWGLCAHCYECAKPRLDQHGPEAVPFLAGRAQV